MTPTWRILTADVRDGLAALPDESVAIPLSGNMAAGRLAILDASDLPMVCGHSWCVRGRTNQVYAATTISGRKVRMHRLLLMAKPGEIIDHINHNTLDNRRCNLRVCTARQSLMNTRARGGTSRFKGVNRVSDNKQRPWRVCIQINGRTKWLGYFATEDEAARCYDSEARMVFKEFGAYNFPIAGEVSALTDNSRGSWS